MIRKIKSLEEREGKSKRNRTIGIAIVIIMAIILIFSYFGYAFFEGTRGTDTNSVQKYNGFDFYRYGEVWKLNLDNKDYYFQYLPQETENVSITGSYSLQTYAGKPLYIVNNNAASQEILMNLGSNLLRYQEACISEFSTNDACKNLPLKNCTDNLMVFVPDLNQTKVWKSENCVYISGEMIRASDAFIYKLFGVK